MHHTTPPKRASLALALPMLLVAGTSAQGQVPDPFAPGLRWSHAPDPGQPWIPRALCFVGDGQEVWAAPAVDTPKLALFASAELPVAGTQPAALFESPVLTGALGRIAVAAGDGPAELFAAAQYPEPSPSTRRTLVTRHDAEEAARTGSFAPLWTYDFGVLVNGPALVATSRDGRLLAAALFDAPRRLLHLAFLNPSTGDALVRRTLYATSLRGLVVSADGTHVAVAAGTVLYVFDAGGSQVFTVTEPSSTQAIALSADGARFAHGSAAGVSLHRDQGSGFALERTRLAGTDELATHVALSDDGETLGVAFWNAADGVSVRLELLATATGVRTNHVAQLGAGSPGLQNFPAALALTPDGARAALGLWGTGDARPEVVLVDSAGGTPRLAVDLPGSVEALALSPDGTRVAVAHKDTHANLFSTTGRVSLCDTGERELQLTGAARPGTQLGVVLAMPQAGSGGPSSAVFALGLATATPRPSRWGDLWIDFQAPHVVLWRGADGDRAELLVPVSSDPAVVGTPLAVQAMRHGAQGLTLVDTVLRPRIL